MNKYLKELLFILLISIFISFIRFQFLDDGYPLLSQSSNSQTNNITVNSLSYYMYLENPELITIDKAKEIYEENFTVFIDAREYSDFIDGHILNAIHVPFSENDKYDSTLIDSLYNLDKTLVIYCSGHGCSLSEDLTYYLYENFDMPSIVYFEEGYPEWKKREFPIKEKNIEINTTKIVKKNNLFNNIDYFIFLSILILVFLNLSKTYRHYIPVIARLILGFIFIYFSIDKIKDPILFAKTAANYDIIPFGLENIGAIILPFIELIIGICLILGVFIQASNAIAFALIILFIFMIFQAYLRGKSIDCGCLLSDLNENSAFDKRAHMLKRIIQDIYFLVLVLIVKYKDKFKR